MLLLLLLKIQTRSTSSGMPAPSPPGAVLYPVSILLKERSLRFTATVGCMAQNTKRT